MRHRIAVVAAAAAALVTTMVTPSMGIPAAHAAGNGPPSDRVVTTDGDMTGLHVLVADARGAYRWRTAATLSEPGTDTDQWIGQSCVTRSGKRAVVVYATRQMTNHQETFAHGALAAVVDLDTGRVSKLPVPVSLAYYDPGCGAGESAVLTEEIRTKGAAVSRLLSVDTATGKFTSTVDVPGQVTSAVPTGHGIVATAGDRLVRVGRDGRLTTLARTGGGSPFRLAVDAAGGVGYEVQNAKTVTVHRYAGGHDRVVLSAPARSLRLAGVAGRLYVQGPHADRFAHLPDGWRGADVPVDAEMSTHGDLAVDSASNGAEAAGDTTMKGTPGGVLPVRITATVTATGQQRTFTVRPAPMRPEQGAAPSPAVPRTGGTGDRAQPTAGSAGDRARPMDGGDPSTTTTDPDRTCAIARNDPRIESLQPTAQMTEWAADLAVKGQLTVQRPAGYNGTGLPAYTPQGLFPPHPLIGGGQVPAQVVLGVMAQESNMWQASPHATDGESGNFEQGGFYGSGSVDSVDFADADCGYGAMQVTTGMTVGDTVYTHDQQVALTVDYAANIAAGLEILQDKWNQMKSLGVIANGGDPKYIENWWFALWAYNTGYHYRNDPSDPYSRSDIAGLGWSNNVRNNDYPADRTGFLDNTTPCTADQKDPAGNCIDAKHPNDWSYPERVMGFAEHSLTRYDWQQGTYLPTFETASWHFGPRIPPLNTFCTMAGNQCDPATAKGGTACTRADFTCYWNQPVTWITDLGEAGTETLAYQPGSPEPAPFHFYQPDCQAGWDALPAGSLVVDDVPQDVHTQNQCAKPWGQHGTLSFKFAADSVGDYPSKIDFHQLDTGFGGHFWMAHAWSETVGTAKHEVTGTWTLDQQLNGWARVLVYVPDHGAMDPQAFYTVKGSDSTSPTRSLVEGNYLDDNRKPAAGHWESLGAFHFNGTPSVSLSNLTHARLGGSFADGERDVAWDAVAFDPLPGKPADMVVAMGDSYSSGEGASADAVDGAYEYYRSSDHDGGNNHDDDKAYQDACHRSPHAWPRQIRLPDDTAQSIGGRADSYDPTLSYHMTACSGAVTDNILAAHEGQYDEGSQIDQGYLDQYTTQVTISIGGNDARFSDVIQKCVLNVGGSCQDSTIDGDSAPLSEAEPEVIDNRVGPAVEATVQAVHAQAPHAKILLMGYPRLFSGSGCLVPISTDEANWLNQMADTLDQRLATAAATGRSNGIAVTFADPRVAFLGKAVCGDPEQIHGPVLSLTRGDDPARDLWQGFGLVSDQSFHPTVDGAATYASVATDKLSTP